MTNRCAVADPALTIRIKRSRKDWPVAELKWGFSDDLEEREQKNGWGIQRNDGRKEKIERYLLT